MILGPIHTNALSLEKAYLSTRLGLPSSPICWPIYLKMLLKDKWIKTKTQTDCISVDGSKAYKNENDDRKYHRLLCL